MRYPWQTWSVYVLCLALGLGAMAWLTAKALELDEAEVAAREKLEGARREAVGLQRKAELEEQISTALWRMDTALAPLLAQEAARPHFVYQPFYSAPGGRNSKAPVEPIASPLLTQPSPFVRLHFQLSSGGQLTSPQCASSAQEPLAKKISGVTGEQLAANRRTLGELKAHLANRELLAQLSPETLQIVPPDFALVNGLAMLNPPGVQQAGAAPAVNPSRQTEQTPIPEAPNPGPPQGQPVGNPNDPLRQQLGAYDVPGSNSQQLNTVAVRGDNRYGDNRYSQSPAQPPNELNLTQPVAQVERQPTPNPSGEQQKLIPPPPAESNPAASLQEENDARLNQSRLGGKWQLRSQAYKNYALQTVAQQRANFNENFLADAAAPRLQLVSEGVSRPIWIDGELLLARRVQIGEETLIQGCWLDWPALKQSLLEEMKQSLLEDTFRLLDEADLTPVLNDAEGSPSRMLATLPAQLVVPEPPLAAGAIGGDLSGGWSPLKISLGLAWGSLLAAALAAAILLTGVMALSERRAAFVAAVTHELRTPLTTFRMYAEMLADGMVTDPERKQSYLDTLKVESDRLYHLVENVLAYARLERSDLNARRQKVSVEQLLARIQPRLEERSEAAEMQLLISAENAAQRIADTDPSAVEQVLFNLVDNACKYAAAAEDKRIHLELVDGDGPIRLRVYDHGPGISADMAARLFQPFSKSVQEAAVSAPGVGLGLALSKRLAEELGGQLEWERGSGASFCLTLPSGRSVSP